MGQAWESIYVKVTCNASLQLKTRCLNVKYHPHQISPSLFITRITLLPSHQLNTIMSHSGEQYTVPKPPLTLDVYFTRRAGWHRARYYLL